MHSNLTNAREIAYRLDEVIAHGEVYRMPSLSDRASELQGRILDSLEFGGIDHGACLQAVALVTRYGRQ